MGTPLASLRTHYFAVLDNIDRLGSVRGLLDPKTIGEPLALTHARVVQHLRSDGANRVIVPPDPVELDGRHCGRPALYARIFAATPSSALVSARTIFLNGT